jgi:transcriptional regulator with XRE-family HTH domain
LNFVELQKILKKHRITITQLEEELGYSKNAISNWRNRNNGELNKLQTAFTVLLELLTPNQFEEFLKNIKAIQN